jgi:hypothetical protein
MASRIFAAYVFPQLALDPEDGGNLPLAHW